MLREIPFAKTMECAVEFASVLRPEVELKLPRLEIHAAEGRLTAPEKSNINIDIAGPFGGEAELGCHYHQEANHERDQCRGTRRARKSAPGFFHD